MAAPVIIDMSTGTAEAFIDPAIVHLAIVPGVPGTARDRHPSGARRRNAAPRHAATCARTAEPTGSGAMRGATIGVTVPIDATVPIVAVIGVPSGPVTGRTGQMTCRTGCAAAAMPGTGARWRETGRTGPGVRDARDRSSAAIAL